MSERVEYEMTEADLEMLLDASKPVPYMIIGGIAPRSTQERANNAWEVLGLRMGFDYMTVRPNVSRGERFFSAVPLIDKEESDV